MIDIEPEKLKRIRAEMARDNIDVLVCRLAENVVFLSGFFCVLGYAAVVFPREGDPVLIASSREEEWYGRGWVSDVRTFPMWDARDTTTPQATHFSSSEHINRLLKQIGDERKFPAKRVGYEGSFEFIAPPVIVPEPVVPGEPSMRGLRAAFPHAELVDATGALNRARAFKTARDVKMLRRTHEVTAMGLEAWKAACLNLSTEAEAAAAFQSAVTAKGIGHDGAMFAMGWPQVFSGPYTEQWVYRPSSTRRIRKGDFVIIELAVCVDGYYSDLTRTLVVGEPNDRQVHLFDTTHRALKEGLALAKPGVAAADIDRHCKATLGEYSKYLLHHSGHGLGWKYHEPIPTLTGSSSDVLAEGMYFAIEPAAYVPGLGGVRNEHNAVVTKTGVEVLSNIFPVSIN
ncbi:M24 family metallopeptidase [Bradyrhizobium cajani]|nr:Xaa-Pro peptidase family protein [Bradyrhizobium cajani]MCP3371819.1 Xaa-Pro peptidase family protein [Bradyrhizobium cajani]